jgi:surface polysaccharide O-acyltransferase-like enzyme
MPLFTFLSGLVYGLRPFAGNSRAFLVGKVRRLLIPMLFVGTLFAVLQALIPGTNSAVGPWYLLHIRPVAHFWFLESLFWVFLVIWLLERWNLIREVKGYLLVLTLACALYLTVRGWFMLGIEGAIYLMPYFLFGLAFSRFPLKPYLTSAWVRWGLLMLAAVAVISMGMPVSNPDRRTVAMLAVGMSLCMLSLSLVRVVPGLAAIGRHSYAIYLFHVFFTAAVRIALNLAHIKLLPIDILLGLAIGLAGPIVLDRIASRFKWPALLLLGKALKTGKATSR